MNFDYEQNLIAKGFNFICGIDEVGRGALAGPLVTGAVILNPEKIEALYGIEESKSLTEKEREEFFVLITQNALGWSVGVTYHFEIDKHGLSFANKIAMKRAWKHLDIKPDYILTDYLAKLYFETPFETIMKGDTKVMSIAAASIVAKVFRDRMMNAFARRYPNYGFDEHKGYGTKLHLEKIKEYGACPIHRLSFAPLKAKLF